MKYCNMGRTLPPPIPDMGPTSSPQLPEMGPTTKCLEKEASQILIITVHNEVVKVMFLQVCVCPQGGIPHQVHPPGPGTPPRTRNTPPDQVHPPTQYSPWDQVHPPEPGTPPGTRYTPQDMATAADSMHPTGMHSCFLMALHMFYRAILRDFFQK